MLISWRCKKPGHQQQWYCPCTLTHWGRVTHICIGKLTIIGWDNGLSPGRRQAIYLNQCWNIVNLTLRSKLQWNFNRNSNIFIQENALENVVSQMVSICLGLNVLRVNPSSTDHVNLLKTTTQINQTQQLNSKSHINSKQFTPLVWLNFWLYNPHIIYMLLK